MHGVSPRHGVIAVASPRVATAQAMHGEITAFGPTMPL